MKILIAFMCNLAMLLLCCIVPAQGTQYPWEVDRAENNSASQSQGSGKEKLYGRFGPFIVQQLENWGIAKDDDGLEMIALQDSWGMVKAAIVQGEHTEMAESDMDLYEEKIRESVEHDYAGRMRLVGKDVLYLRDMDWDSTLFILLPNQNDKVYILYVAYDKKVEEITPEVKRLLSTLHIQEPQVE